MKNTILLITRNSAHVLTDFFKSVDKYVNPDKYDLFIWDNGSRQGDYEYLRYLLSIRPKLRYPTIQSYKDRKNCLFTYAANQLINSASNYLEEVNKYKNYIIVNPDIEFTENWDLDLDNNKGVMGFLLVKENGIVEHYGGFEGGEHIARGEIWEKGKYTETLERDWVTFGCVAITSDVIKKCGLLDENYPHFSSDREYCRKARQEGFKVICSHRKLIHGYGKSTRPYVINNVPDDIWKRHVLERKQNGVYFPDNQADMKPYDQTVIAEKRLGYA